MKPMALLLAAAYLAVSAGVTAMTATRTYGITGDNQLTLPIIVIGVVYAAASYGLYHYRNQATQYDAKVMASLFVLVAGALMALPLASDYTGLSAVYHVTMILILPIACDIAGRIHHRSWTAATRYRQVGTITDVPESGGK